MDGAGDIAPGDEITFALQTPLNDEIIAGHVRHAMTLDLPDAQQRKTLIVVANGPSATKAPFLTPGAPTLALNGALRQFTERGLAPTYWAACDPQELVADFLHEAPPETVYLVASKCHPAVFKALRRHRVIRWHVADQAVPGRLRAPLCCSITATALWEVTRPRFGFTDFEVYGWDACYLDGQHHAGDAASDYQTRPDFVAIDYGGRTIETTRAWSAEADHAGQLFDLFRYLDFGLNIHGEGLMATLHEALAAHRAAQIQPTAITA